MIGGSKRVRSGGILEPIVRRVEDGAGGIASRRRVRVGIALLPRGRQVGRRPRAVRVVCVGARRLAVGRLCHRVRLLQSEANKIFVFTCDCVRA